MKKCHLAFQLCLRAAGCEIDQGATSWEQFRALNGRALGCPKAGPPLGLAYRNQPVGLALIRDVARSFKERLRLEKLYAAQAKGGESQTQGEKPSAAAS